MSSRLLYKGYYLCILNSDGDVVSIDGSHDHAIGVATAKKLIQRIFNDSREFKMVHIIDDLEIPKNERWHSSIDKMIKSEIIEFLPVPDQSEEVDEEAVGICAALVKAAKE